MPSRWGPCRPIGDGPGGTSGTIGYDTLTGRGVNAGCTDDLSPYVRVHFDDYDTADISEVASNCHAGLISLVPELGGAAREYVVFFDYDAVAEKYVIHTVEAKPNREAASASELAADPFAPSLNGVNQSNGRLRAEYVDTVSGNWHRFAITQLGWDEDDPEVTQYTISASGFLQRVSGPCQSVYYNVSELDCNMKQYGLALPELDFIQSKIVIYNSYMPSPPPAYKTEDYTSFPHANPTFFNIQVDGWILAPQFDSLYARKYIDFAPNVAEVMSGFGSGPFNVPPGSRTESQYSIALASQYPHLRASNLQTWEPGDFSLSSDDEGNFPAEWFTSMKLILLGQDGEI